MNRTIKVLVLLLASFFLAACGGGKNGKEGAPALVNPVAEPPGELCEAGGWLIQSGTDKNRDGTLSANEVQSVSHICNTVGADGQDGRDGVDGKLALTAISPMGTGDECPAGGHRIDAGVDLNGNGTLDANEVQQTEYVCHGVDGQDGAAGQDGADGTSVLIHTTDEEPGEECPAGGIRVHSGIDSNRNGILDADEISLTRDLCHGETGVDGQNGADGQSPLQALLSSTQIPSGPQCSAGGYRLDTGLDTNRNGELDTDEIQSTSYICHGIGGTAAQEFTLQYSAQSGGYIIGSTVQNVLLGDSGTTVTAVPNDGYYFTSWSDDLTTARRTDASVQSNLTVQAGFAQYQYTLAYTSGGNGTITGIVEQTVFHGSNGTSVQAEPDSGYHFVQWSDGNTDNPRTDIHVQSSRTVIAQFLQRHVLAYSPGNGGVIDGAATQTVIDGDTAKPVTAMPNAGYIFKEWSDGRDDNPRTDVDVKSSISVSAIFELNQSARTPWLESMHKGALVVDVKGPTKAVLNWPTIGSGAWNIYITSNMQTDLNHYAAYGATLEIGVAPPYTLTIPANGQPVYVALERNGELTGWTSLTSKVWGFNQAVSAVAIADDGTRYVGGNFSHVHDVTTIRKNGSALPIAVAGFSESHPLPFPSVNGEVRTAVSDGLGGWYIGGSFTQVGGKERLSLAQIDSRGRLTDWNPSVDQAVSSIVVMNDIVYTGGGFNYAKDSMGIQAERNYLAAFDRGGDLLDWNPSVNNWVRTLAVSENTIYAGGDFTYAGSEVKIARHYLAAFDSTGSLLSWSPSVMGGTVNTLIASGNRIYVGGHFTNAQGNFGNQAERNHLAAFDNSGRLLNWNPSVGVSGSDHRVHSLIESNGAIYVGGHFSGTAHGSNGLGSNRENLAAFDEAGNLLPWSPRVSGGIVSAISVSRDMIYVGGRFTSAQSPSDHSTKRNHLAVFDKAANLLDWDPGADGSVITLAVSDDIVYVGGGFSRAGGSAEGQARESLAAFDNEGNLLSWRVTIHGGVRALATLGDAIYIGGLFTGTRDSSNTLVARRGLAAFDKEGNHLNWSSGVSGPVNTLMIAGNTIYAGGQFKQAGGYSGTDFERTSLAAFDLEGNLLNWNPRIQHGPDSGGGASSGVVEALVISGDSVYVGGNFTHAQGSTGDLVERNHLAVFDTSGSLLGWDSGVSGSGSVRSLAMLGSTLYVGGGFSHVRDPLYSRHQQNGLAAFDNSGNLLSWRPVRPGAGVHTIAISGDTIYAGGNFSSLHTGSSISPDLIQRTHLAAFDSSRELLSWHPRVGSTSSGIGDIRSLTKNKGFIFVGGTFSHAGLLQEERSNFAVFDSEGNLQNQ